MPRHVLTEDELIRMIQRTSKSRGRVRLGIGDDAAVLRDGRVVTTDAYAEGVHFDLSYMSLRQVGERCACGAISDVVAMAADPEAVFVSLVLPRDWQTSAAGGVDARRRVRELYSGVERVCAETGCEVAGGDIIVSERLVLAFTVTGRARRPRLRSGAAAGDKLYVTGYLGSAEAGRILLAAGGRTQNRDGGPGRQPVGRRRTRGDWRLPLFERHLRPMPRLAAMQALRPRFAALIDTSDGLATDARHICEMSQVKIVVDASRIPIAPATTRFCADRGLEPLDFVLGAGEDYELLFTSRRPIPPMSGGVKITAIGRVEDGRGLWMRRLGSVLPVTASGYDHMRATVLGRTCY